MLHRWLRNTHLILGLLAFPMVMVYGVSAVQMAHHDWFSEKPTVTESEVDAGPFGPSDGRALAQSLMDRYAMHGEVQQVRTTDEGIRLRIVRPGTVYDVEYVRQTGKAKVETSVAGFMGMLNRLHHAARMNHSYEPVNIWGGLVAFVSATLILLGLSGVYLWFKIHDERVIGAILLALSLGFSLTLITIIRFS
jgi:hypothetical protein